MIRTDAGKRKGVALVAVLVALGLLMVMLTVTMQWALRNRREARKQLLLSQTTWLCEAGLQRALHQVNRNANYRGEQWRPTLPEYALHQTLVQISVEATSTQKSIRVVAELYEPNSLTQRFQRSLQHVRRVPSPFLEGEGPG